MSKSEFSWEDIIAEACGSFEIHANKPRLDTLSQMIHQVEEDIGEERFNPTSSDSKFQRIMAASTQLPTGLAGSDNIEALTNGSMRYAELHFMKTKMIQLEKSIESNGRVNPDISLEPNTAAVVNPLWIPPSQDILSGMTVGMRSGISRMLQMLVAEFPGYREEDWVSAEHDAEFVNGKWVYKGETCLDGVNVLFAYRPDSTTPELSLGVLPL